MSEKIYNMVDLETIEKLADIVAAKELGEITIADGEKYITVKGKKCLPPMPLAGVPVAASPAVSAAAPAAPAEVLETVLHDGVQVAYQDDRDLYFAPDLFQLLE